MPCSRTSRAFPSDGPGSGEYGFIIHTGRQVEVPAFYPGVFGYMMRIGTPGRAGPVALASHGGSRSGRIERAYGHRHRRPPSPTPGIPMPALRRAARARAAVAALAATSLLPLAACAVDGGARAAEPDPASAPAGRFPLTLDNCGVAVTLDHAPEHIVTIKSSTTEMLLALGLADRLVGAAFLDGPVPDEFGAADLPILSDKVPGQEAVLSTGADLVYAGWESNFSADGAGERESLSALGVATYVSPSACKEAGYQPDPLTFDTVFDEITEAGRVLGVPDAAADLVADQRAELASIEPDTTGRTALWYSSGDDIPY